MTRAFDLALHRAKNMSRPRPPSITIGIDFNQSSIPMAGGGGLSSIQKRMNIGGEPHRLTYINSGEEDLLRQLGGSGQLVNGIPAYVDMGEGLGGYGDIAGGAADTGGLSDTADTGLGMGYGAGISEGWTDPEVDKDEQAGVLGRGYDWMGYGKTEDIPDWSGRTWGVQDPETGKSLQDKGWLESLTAPGPMDVLGGLFNLKGSLFTLGIKGVMAAVKSFKQGLDDRAALQDVIDDPNTSQVTRDEAQEALDEMNKGYGDDLYDDYPSEEPVKKDKKIVKKEEEEEAKKLRGMALYLEDYRKEDRPPVGFKESELAFLKRAYPDPEHPIWETINREREPMWPSIEEETAVV